MQSFFWFFKNRYYFQKYFKNSNDVKRSVIRRGWHHFNMQSIVFVAGLVIFNSLEMLDVVTYLGLGFISFTTLIYFNTQRNIKFSEKING